MTDVLTLLDDVYEAGADPALWPAVMVRLADSIGAGEAVLGGIGLGRTPLFMAPRTDPAMIKSYIDHYHAQNPLQVAMLAKPVNKVLLDAELTNLDAFHRGAFYNEWCRPQGLVRGAAVNLATGGFMGTIMVTANQSFEEPQVALLQQLAPHLARAFRINQLLQESLATTLSAFSALEMTERGVFVVDLNGRVSACNGLAESLVSPGKGLTLSHGRLICALPADTTRLHRMIHNCFARGAQATETTMSVAREAGRPPLHLVCLPFTADGRAPSGDQLRVMIVVTDPADRLRRQAERLRRMFKLTHAEANVALELALGGDRGTLAARLGISVATVRSQLTSIFDKTGVRRQAELVRILMDQ